MKECFSFHSNENDPFINGNCKVLWFKTQFSECESFHNSIVWQQFSWKDEFHFIHDGMTRLTNEYPCIHWILSWILNTSLVFGIHPQSEYWIPCCIQYSGDYWILWWEWYSVFSHKKKTKNYSYSVFSRENILSYKVIVSIHLCEKVSIQYSIQYSVMLTGRYSVFNTVFSLDDIWGSQYSTQYSVNTAIL